MKLNCVIRQFAYSTLIGVMLLLINNNQRAEAAITAYNSEATFVSTAGLFSMESFEAPFVSWPMKSFSEFTVTETGPGAGIGFRWSNEFSTDGSRSLALNFDGTSIVFDFYAPIYSFGLNIDNPYNIPLTFNSEFGDTLSIPVVVNPSFFGVISDTSFTQVTLTSSSGSGEYLAFDELYSGPIAPEPVSSTLFLIGGATLGFRRLRKKLKK